MGGYRDEYFKKNASKTGWYTCAGCGKKLRKEDVDVDHIIPQSRGGVDSEWNLQSMCKTCNRSKQKKMDNTPQDLLNSGKRIVKRKIKNEIKKEIEKEIVKNPVTDFILKKLF